MSASKQRINVTLEDEDLQVIQLLSRKKKISMSSLIKHMVHEWLEEYEDYQLIEKIEKREKENNPLIKHEDYWKETE
jgi:hypothetical protein